MAPVKPHTKSPGKGERNPKDHIPTEGKLPKKSRSTADLKNIQFTSEASTSYPASNADTDEGGWNEFGSGSFHTGGSQASSNSDGVD